ncbi:MAG: flagellar hook-associated protein FlgK [Lachnospiraceae bacterium]
MMLRSTFSGFTTAQLAMQASRAALDVAGQNIANINTNGYTRQRLDVVSLYNKNGNFYNTGRDAIVGFGVDVKGISQIRDPFLDVQYRNQIAKVGAADSKQGALDQLSNIFDETTRDAIDHGLSDLEGKLRDLSNPTNVGNKVFDSMVRSSCQTLLDYFHQNASQLQDVKKDLTTGLTDNVIPDINDILTEITKLNESIKNSQVLGNPGLELQDARNMMLDDLASYLPIDVKYTSETLAGNNKSEVLKVSFRDSSGTEHVLVDDTKHGSLSADVKKHPLELLITDTEGNTGDPLDPDHNVASLLKSGSLKGTIDMVNESGLFSGDDSTGVGYYEKSFDGLVNAFAKTFNDLNSTPDLTEPIDPNAPRIQHPLFKTSDGSTTFTAANIQISDEWLSGVTRITTATAENKGSTNNDNVLNMIAAISQKRDFTGTETISGTSKDVVFFKGSFQECYSNMNNVLAIDSKSNTTLLKNNITVINQVSNSRDSISSVSLDEEGMSLMHYQQSFTAAARLMTTLDEAMDVLINKTGTVGR